MHRVVVLVEGFVRDSGAGRQRAGGTITLVRGRPNVLVDTGDALQRDALLAGLAREGLDAGDIDYVINTHGHLDHVGNNGLFPGATFVLDSDVAQGGEYWTHDFDAGPYRIPAAEGAPPVTVMRTPGHTDHDLSVLVGTDAGRVAIVGDLFEHDHDDDGSWLQWSRDRTRQQSSREYILGEADIIIPGHGAPFRPRRDHGA